MNKFREKLLDFKKRLSDRKMYSVTIALIAVVAGWGIYQYKDASAYRQKLDNMYNRAYFDLTGYVQNVDSLLVKALVSSTPQKTSSLLKEAWRQSNLAQENLGQLPVSQPVLSSTSKFLTQVGDYSYTLSTGGYDNKPLDENQYTTLEMLNKLADNLKNSLNSFQDDLTSGRIKWGQLSDQGSKVFAKTSAQTQMKEVENIDKTFQDYPTLIYDGPFSDHITSITPKGIDLKKVSMEQAKNKIYSIYDKNSIKEIKDTGSMNIPPLNTYNFEVTFNNLPADQKANFSITQLGGQVLWLLKNRDLGPEKLKMDNAKIAAKSFLDKLGFENMKDTYYIKEDGTATINFASTQGDVILYPDLVKVKIALDNGEIIGMESKGYIMSHHNRLIPEPSISMEQAKKMINTKIEVLSSGKAIIPTEYKTELNVYQFKGKVNKRDFIIYINSQTGKEEDILIIIDTPNGILTM